MDVEQFFRAVWPGTGLYALAIPFVPRGSERAVFKHQVFETKGAAIATAHALASQHNVYFCVHTLKERRVWNPTKINRKTGETGAWEIRVQRNTKAARSLFLDIDVDPDTDKKYPTQAAGVLALREFVKATALPAPTIVSSGGGLHVYWSLDEDMPSEDWRPLAALLKSAANAHGLKIDPSRTTDSASVLRVPGTINHKKTPLPVQILRGGVPTSAEKLRDILSAVAGTQQAALFPGQQRSFSGFEDNTTLHTAPPPSMKALISACGQVQHVIRHAATLPEPLWYAALGVVRHTAQGDAAAHKISQPYPGYTQTYTDEKLHYLASKGIGPTTCEKFDELNPGVCGTCAYRGSAKSPLVIARKVDELPPPKIAPQQPTPTVSITPAVPAAPFPYRRTPSGIFIESTVKGKDDEPDFVEQVKILSHDFFPVRRYKDMRREAEMHLWVADLPHVGQIELALPADAMYDNKKLSGLLAHRGVFVNSKMVPQVSSYMVAYIKQLQSVSAPEVLRTALGWNDTLNEFTFPSHVLREDGTQAPITLDHAAASSLVAVTKDGTLERQVELLKFFKHTNYTPNQFAICAALGSPLFYMTGHHGVVVNMSGPPGASKSTTLYTGAGLWGHPVKLTINGTTRGATANARDNRIMALSNLPVMVDEITQMSPRDAAELAMSITQAEGRLRLDSTGAERRVTQGNKSTIMLSTANTSLYNLIAAHRADGVAESVRVIELTFSTQNVHTKVEADDYLEDLKHNYGHIGERFMQYVVTHREQVHAKVRQVMRTVDETMQIAASERFWSAAVAVSLVACEIAEDLGLLFYDKRRIWEWVAKTQIPTMRGHLATQYASPAMILADYLESINGNMLVLQNVTPTESQARWRNNMPTVIRQPTNAQLLARHEIDRGIIWIKRSSFRDYCMKIGLNYTALTDTLKASGVLSPKPAHKVLGAGTDYAKGQTVCWLVNVHHPDMAGELAESPIKVVPIKEASGE